MSNQKQRRRRAKERRHDYDLIEIDGEGNETVLSATDLKEPDTSRSKPTAAKSKSQSQGGRRGPQPPSWHRVLKRGGLFAPIFLATVLLLGGGKVTFAAAVFQAALLVAVFVPFSYVMDRFVWRSYQKRLAKNG